MSLLWHFHQSLIIILLLVDCRPCTVVISSLQTEGSRHGLGNTPVLLMMMPATGHIVSLAIQVAVEYYSGLIQGSFRIERIGYTTLRFATPVVRLSVNRPVNTCTQILGIFTISIQLRVTRKGSDPHKKGWLHFLNRDSPTVYRREMAPYETSCLPPCCKSPPGNEDQSAISRRRPDPRGYPFLCGFRPGHR